MYKKFIFILSVFVLIFFVTSSSFASSGVTGLTYNVPESPDFPNHTYIFIYQHETGHPSTSGMYLLKYYMPIVLIDKSRPASSYFRLRIELVNALSYKYNPDSDIFEPHGTFPRNVTLDGTFMDVDGNGVSWDDPSAVTGIFPLASNHNIYIDDDTLFFWTPQMSTDCPHLYRLPVTQMMKTLLVVGGRTLGIVLAIFGIVSVALWAKRLIFSFLL